MLSKRNKKRSRLKLKFLQQEKSLILRFFKKECFDESIEDIKRRFYLAD